jgi:hypothetical protein
MAAKDNVTHLDIILEAIRYIDSLQDKLADKIDTGEIVPIQVFDNSVIDCKYENEYIL